MKYYRYDIAILRLFCITIVVLFHAYGMMYSLHFGTYVRHMYSVQYEFFNQTYLINIAMPMFVFISGFLFGGQLMKKQPYTFVKMIKSKFMRLMVPFFVFAVFFMFTQNAVSINPFYQWTYNHLWFLPMLFWCFVFTYLLRPLILSKKYYISIPTVVVLLLIAIPGRLFDPFLGLHRVNVWIGWFALGVWFCSHEQTLTLKNMSLLIKTIILVLCLVIYFLIIRYFPFKYGTMTVCGIIATLAALYFLWLIFTWISWQNFVLTDYLVSLSACSFGIYIFHYWLEAHMISRTAQRVFPLEQWALEHVYLFPFLFATTSFLISLGITWLLLKFKIGRKLIG